MDLESLKLLITKHAHEQYCDRVEAISKTELLKATRKQVHNGAYRKWDFIQLDGIWWIYEIYPPYLILVTCYGRSSFDLPRAVRWARIHNDRINLKT